MNSQKGTWLLAILGMITIILVGILIFVPASKKSKESLPVNINGIEITSPKSGEEISLPIKITGTVNGNGWGGFEGQVGTVKLFDHNGLQLGQTAILNATTSWTTSPINFEANLVFTSNGAKDATLIFYNENPSGDPAKDKTFTLPIKIK